MDSETRSSVKPKRFPQHSDVGRQQHAYGYTSPSVPSSAAPGPGPSIAQLVAAVYCAVPIEVRVKMLEYLLRPLSMLSLVAVAQGAFAKIRFRHADSKLKVRADDTVRIPRADVVSLVDHVLQVDERVVRGLAPLLQSMPAVRELDAAVALVAQLGAPAHLGAGQAATAQAIDQPVWH